MDTNQTKQFTLAGLAKCKPAKILKIVPKSRGEKKFADIGLVPGTELVLEERAPFGGLLRVKIMGTSIALHSSDARNIILS